MFTKPSDATITAFNDAIEQWKTAAKAVTSGYSAGPLPLDRRAARSAYEKAEKLWTEILRDGGPSAARPLLDAFLAGTNRDTRRARVTSLTSCAREAAIKAWERGDRAESVEIMRFFVEGRNGPDSPACHRGEMRAELVRLGLCEAPWDGLE